MGTPFSLPKNSPEGSSAARGRGIKFRSVISADTPQGGFSCPCGAIHLLCGGNDTSRADQPDFFDSLKSSTPVGDFLYWQQRAVLSRARSFRYPGLDASRP